MKRPLWSGAANLRRMLSNVREPSSVFVGRVADLATIAAHFDDGARIVTIVAPGGMGKTRLAQRFAATQL